MLNHCGLKQLKVNHWPSDIQFKMTTSVTLLACAFPLSCLWKNPSKKMFLMSQTAVCLSFFLFSMQVHEKQILSAMIMLSLLAATGELEWLLPVANLVSLSSMFTLLTGDSSDELAFALQLLVIGLAPKKIPVLIGLFCTLWIPVATFYWQWDLLMLVGHCVHFICFGLMLAYLYWLMGQEAFAKVKV
jgi:hypothetical protein